MACHCLVKSGKRERGKNQRKLILPCLCAGGRKNMHSVVQNDTVLSLFGSQCMKRHRFSQNASFHLKRNGTKNMSKFKSVLTL